MKKKNNIYRLIFIFVAIIVFFTVLYYSFNKNVSILLVFFLILFKHDSL